MAAVASVAVAHNGGNSDFRSKVRAITPAVEGVTVRVLNFDDSLLLTNRSKQTVIVKGYRGEPFIRIKPDGSSWVNQRSPTYYLSNDRFAKDVDVPAQANPKAAPAWINSSYNGTFEWHDHRVHWMARTVPPQVKDESKRTKVFDWRVPLTVGGRTATIQGALIWVGRPDAGGASSAGLIAAIGGAILVGLVCVGVFLWRRRRRARGVAVQPEQEAW